VQLRVLNAVIYHVTISAFLNASRYPFTFLTQVSTYRVPSYVDSRPVRRQFPRLNTCISHSLAETKKPLIL